MVMPYGPRNLGFYGGYEYNNINITNNFGYRSFGYGNAFGSVFSGGYGFGGGRYYPYTGGMYNYNNWFAPMSYRDMFKMDLCYSAGNILGNTLAVGLTHVAARQENKQADKALALGLDGGHLVNVGGHDIIVYKGKDGNCYQLKGKNYVQVSGLNIGDDGKVSFAS